MLFINNQLYFLILLLFFTHTKRMAPRYVFDGCCCVGLSATQKKQIEKV